MKNLIPRIRPIIYRAFSEQLINKFLKINSKLLMAYYSINLKKVKKIFNQASEHPVWLGWNELVYLQKKYTFPFNKLKSGNDIKILSKKGKSKALELINFIKSEHFNYSKFLELGCNDGMVCYFLKTLEKEAIGIDINSNHFDRRALEAGVNLQKMDATNLQFKNNSFDFVFTYDSFEHFLEPDKVLEEAIRVLKKNGYIYIKFSLPYTSPWGLHAFKTITVPYCQFLFPLDLMREFAKSLRNVRPLPSGEFPLNKWPTEDYRKLWKEYSDKLEIITYKELFDFSHLEIIKQYTSCFKSKTRNFDDLIVNSMEILLKKIK